MYRVNQATKDFYKGYSGKKEYEFRIPNANITIHNDELVAQSLNLNEAIENGDNLTFTGCIASCLKFTCTDIVQNLKGEYIEADILGDDDELEPIPLFRGYIDSSTNHSHEQVTMDIVAYDALKTANDTDVTDWYNSLSFPITMKNFRDSLCTELGLEQVDDYLTNDAMTIYKTITDKSIMAGQLLKWICEINGSYGKINREGKFQYIHLVEGTEALYPREDLYPADDLYPHAENASETTNKAHYMSIEFENYEVAPITKVQLIGKDGSVVATSGIRAAQQNVFTVHNNPLIYDKSQSDLDQVATNLYNTIQRLWYVPFDVQCVGLPYVECGDFILTATKRSIVRSYVLNRNMTGTGALRDNFASEGDEELPAYKVNEQTKINANAYNIDSESSRAQGAESGLNTGLNNANVRISQIDADVGNFKNVTAQNFNAVNGSIGTLNANVASLGSVVAGKADIGQLNALSARVGTIEARYITASQVDAKVANQGWVNIQHLNVSGVSQDVATKLNSLQNQINAILEILRNR